MLVRRLAFETVLLTWVAVTYSSLPGGITTAAPGCVPPYATYADLPALTYESCGWVVVLTLYRSAHVCGCTLPLPLCTCAEENAMCDSTREALLQASSRQPLHGGASSSALPHASDIACACAGQGSASGAHLLLPA